MARWLADYPEWLQFCWDFIKPPRNDEIALQHFFLACSSARFFFLLHLCCIQFFSSNKRLQEIFFQNHPSPPPQKLNGRPLRWSGGNGLLSLASITPFLTDQFSVGGVSEAISNQIIVYIVMSCSWAAQAVEYLRHNQFFLAPKICKLNSIFRRRNKSVRDFVPRFRLLENRSLSHFRSLLLE